MREARSAILLDKKRTILILYFVVEADDIECVSDEEER